MEVDEHFDELLARAGNPARGESSLGRLARRRLNAREVALGEEDSEAGTGGNLSVDLGDLGLDAADRSSAGLARRRPAGFSSHSLLSSHSLVGSGLSSHNLSSHTLSYSSHNLSSTVFSSHSRFTVQIPAIDLGPSPGLTQAPAAAPEAGQVAAPAGGIAAPEPVASPGASAPTAAPATGPAPVAVLPPPRPGQIKGADTVKRVAPRKRR
jgi:hypothetical protein